MNTTAQQTTEIISNGSKWAGEEPDSIDALLAVLSAHPLDRTFEAYGNFIAADPVNMHNEPLLPSGGVAFFGNFFTLSHGFSIHTTDPAVIERLSAAIRANQQCPDYLAQPDEIERQRIEEAARRKRDEKRNAERRRVLERELSELNGVAP